MRNLLSVRWAWSFIAALAMWVAAASLAHGQGAGAMATSALALAVFMVIAGIGQMVVITLGPGNIDLSLAANMGLASAVAMTVMNGEESLVWLGLLAALGAGGAIGVANYILIRLLRIPPIIATLSASFIIQSIDISCGRGLQIKPPTAFADFTNAQLMGVPVLAFFTLVVTFAVGILLYRTVYGRAVLAVGQNSRAARLAGFNVERARFFSYGLCGLLGGLDGALLAAYFRGANVDIGNEYLLASIAVVVLGGTSASGGKPAVPGLWGAALFMVLLLTLLDTFGISAGFRLLLTGAAIVAVITVAGGPKALA
jgi:ribose transport system permease protein